MSFFTPLAAKDLELQLKPNFKTLEFHAKLASTSSRALELGAASLPALIVCEHQSAGRGRRRRTWLSPAGTSLTFSAAAKLDPTAAPAGLSLAIAVTIVDVLGAAGFSSSLKWPNDVIGPGGGKLGGILVELANANVVVAGLGLNLHEAKEHEREHHEDASLLSQAEYLDTQQRPIDRGALLVSLAFAIERQIRSWPEPGMDKMLRSWQDRCVHKQGDALQVTGVTGEKQSLLYVGLGGSGELRAKDQAGRTHSFASAEVACESAGN